MGDASAEVSRSLGFSDVKSATGDVAALAVLVTESCKADGGALLHPAGSAVAGDLGGAVEAAGFEYRRIEAYEATPIRALPPSVIAAVKEGAIDAALFYSPRTAETFADLARKSRLVRPLREVVALCLSPAVAEKAKEVHWSDIRVAEKPDQESLLALCAELGSLAPATLPPTEAQMISDTPRALPSPQSTPPDRPSIPSPSEPSQARKTSLSPTMVAIAAVVVIGVLLGVTRSSWMPALSALLGGGTSPVVAGSELQKLGNRIEALEKKSGDQAAPAVDALKQQQVQLQAQVGGNADAVATIGRGSRLDP